MFSSILTFKESQEDDSLDVISFLRSIFNFFRSDASCTLSSYLMSS